MLKNNIYALLVHLFFILIIVVLGHYINSKLSLIFYSINLIILALYFFVGTMMHPKDSKLKNLLSVSSIGIIGIVLWLFTDVSRFLLLYYSFPVSSVIILILKYILHKTLNSQAQILLVILPFISTLLMWLGLEWKASRKKLNQHEIS